MAGSGRPGGKTGVGLVSSPSAGAHDTGPAHPERPERLAAILERLEAEGLAGELAFEEAGAAPVEALTRVHPHAYLERIAAEIEEGRPWIDSPDVPVSPASYRAALDAAGAAIEGTRRVLRGEWSSAFVLTRPPGHHAERDRAMGFCLLNNVVIAAQAARAEAEGGVSRVAIVDWDVHHGNGTQHLTEEDGELFYASLHQFPHYPGTGSADERGRGAGEGTVLNCPEPPGSGGAQWLADFEGRVLPALEAFAPDLILISAGFDAHRLDPLSETLLEARDYARMTAGLAEVAARTCGGRMVSLLEGGYSLEGLAASAAAHVATLIEWSGGR